MKNKQTKIEDNVSSKTYQYSTFPVFPKTLNVSFHVYILKVINNACFTKKNTSKIIIMHSNLTLIIMFNPKKICQAMKYKF